MIEGYRTHTRHADMHYQARLSADVDKDDSFTIQFFDVILFSTLL